MCTSEFGLEVSASSQILFSCAGQPLVDARLGRLGMRYHGDDAADVRVVMPVV